MIFTINKYLMVWLGEANVSYILCHRGVQRILAYNWARPAVLVANKDRRVEGFLFVLFLYFHSFSSFFPVSSLLLSLLSFFSAYLGDDKK